MVLRETNKDITYNSYAITKQIMLHFMEEPRQSRKGKAFAYTTSQIPGVQTASNRDLERSILHMLKEMQSQIGSLAKTQARLEFLYTSLYSCKAYI